MGDFPKNDFWPYFLTEVSFEGNFNAADKIFESSFQGYPTCLYTVPLQVARWQVAGWPGGQVTGGTN